MNPWLIVAKYFINASYKGISETIAITALDNGGRLYFQEGDINKDEVDIEKVHFTNLNTPIDHLGYTFNVSAGGWWHDSENRRVVTSALPFIPNISVLIDCIDENGVITFSVYKILDRAQ